MSYHRQCSGGAFPYGGNCRQEDQNGSAVFTWKSFCDPSAIRFLEEGGYHVRNKVCMVIGNGEMGKMAAQTLREAGADVTVTIRQYRSGVVSIPVGCSRINYGERMDYLPECDLVVSATASPNYTLTKNCLRMYVWNDL